MTIFIDASLVKPANGTPLRALNMARYIVPDIQNVVGNDPYRIGNEPGKYSSGSSPIITIRTGENIIYIRNSNPVEEDLIAEVFDINGKFICNGKLKEEISFNVNRPGIYIVRCFNSSYNKVFKVLLTR